MFKKISLPASVVALMAFLAFVGFGLLQRSQDGRLAVNSVEAQAPDDLEYGFLDQTNGSYLLVQWGTTHPSYGHFVFAAPWLGVVWPDGPATITSVSGGYTVSYSGAGKVDPAAIVDTVLGSTFQKVGEPQVATIAFTATVDSARVVGTATITVNGQPYTLSALAPVHDAENTAASALIQALLTDDWVTLHSLLYSRFQAALSVAELTAAVQQDLAANGTLPSPA